VAVGVVRAVGLACGIDVLIVLQKRDSASMGSSLSVPAAKRKKMPISRILLDSSDDSSSDEDLAKSIVKKPPSSGPSAMWKIDRLKASLQKPSSESKDKQPQVEPRVQKHSTEKTTMSEEQSKEGKDKVRKEEVSHAKEKHDKMLDLTERVPKTPTHAEDRSQKDASNKTSKVNEETSFKPLEKGNSDSKQNKQTGSKPLEKENRSDGKQRQTYVIPKLKKPAETPPKSTPVVDTWSDMLRRGAELEKNRYMKTPNSSGMRRIPKIPKAGLCGQTDVGVLDKIEQDPGFLKWQQAASQRNAPKTDDERRSLAAKISEDTGSKQQASSVIPGGSILSDPQPSTPVTPLITPTSMTGNSQETNSLLSTPLSAYKKVLLPTPHNMQNMSSRAIPVLVGRGKAVPPVRSSPVIDKDTFVPDETANHPG